MGVVDETFMVRRKNLERLMEARFEGSQAQLAGHIGRSPTTVWRLLTHGPHAKHIGERLAREIEKRLLLPSGWLDAPAQTLHSPPRGGDVAIDHGNVVPVEAVPSPVPLFDAEGAARWLDNGTGTGLAMVWCNTLLSKRAFALVVRGNSMLPDFFPGDRVFVDPDVRPAPGDVVLAKIRGELAIRKYRPANDAGTEFELSAFNPDYAPARASEASIVGVVVEHHRYRGPRQAAA